MNNYVVFACFSLCLTCVDLNLSSNSIYISDLQQVESDLLHNTDDNLLEVKLLMPHLPVLSNRESVRNDNLNTKDMTSVIKPSPEAWPSASSMSSQCGLLPNTSRAAAFEDIASFNDSVAKLLPDEEGNFRHQLNPGVKKITCLPRNISDLNSLSTVKIVNSSELLQHLGSRNTSSGQCTVVLFYAPWCLFSAKAAPHYNALARAFPKLDVLAIDAFHFSTLNSRFGTIAVPNVMVFHNAKAIARFNGSERILPSLISFVSNVTGMQANPTVEVMAEDYVGPLQSEPSQEIDYLLLLSWLFVIICCVMGIVRSSAGVRVWNTLVAMGHHEQHHHQHID